MNGAATRRSSSIEARAASSLWRRLVLPTIVALAAAMALFVGKEVSQGNLLIGLLSAATLAGIAIFRYLGLPAWCSLLLIAAVAARGPRTALGLPAIADFLHYPIALLFALAAADRRPRAASRTPGRWLTGLLLVVLLSAIAHPDNPMRTLLFLLIAGEPLLIIWAISRWVADQDTLRTVGAITLVLVATEVALGVYQGVTYGWADPVQGTLAGHGAGAHVLGSLFALVLFILAAGIRARRLNPILGGVGTAACLGMIIATGSMSVLVIATFAVVIQPFLAGPSVGAAVRPRRLSAITITIFLGAAALAFAATWVPGVYGRAARLATAGRLDPEIAIIRDRAGSDPLAVLLGSGPGTSSSRASLLLALGVEEGSPLAFLGLEPTDLGRELAAADAFSEARYGGSVESVTSGVLGVVGDLGVVGLVAWGVLLFAIWRRLGKSRSWLAPAARSALLMAAALSFVDNWLEYPEFAVPLAILIGFVVSDIPDGA